MRKYLLVLVLAVALVLVVLPTIASAEPTHPTFRTFVNAGDVPSGSVLVLNATYKVTNDEDSGNVGYWALLNYNKHVQVWQVPDGTYYTVARYAGKWTTFAGALSPGAGVTQAADASGTFEGGYTATFTTGSPTPELTTTFAAGSPTLVSGQIGTYDFTGTQADILLGTYGAGQTGSSPSLDWLGTYFPGYANFTYLHWGWTYHYESQTWNNFDYGTTGDILAK
jgi:hypothetical protein